MSGTQIEGGDRLLDSCLMLNLCTIVAYSSFLCMTDVHGMLCPALFYRCTLQVTKRHDNQCLCVAIVMLCLQEWMKQIHGYESDDRDDDGCYQEWLDNGM